MESPPPSDTGRPAIPIRHNQPNTPPSTHYIPPEQVARKIEASFTIGGISVIKEAVVEISVNCYLSDDPTVSPVDDSVAQLAKLRDEGFWRVWAPQITSGWTAMTIRCTRG